MCFSLQCDSWCLRCCVVWIRADMLLVCNVIVGVYDVPCRVVWKQADMLYICTVYCISDIANRLQ